MRATDTAALVWAAALCAALVAWAAQARPRRRARHVLAGPWTDAPIRWQAAAAPGRKPGERLRDAAGAVRTRLERYAARHGGWAARSLARWAGPEALCLPAGIALAVPTRSVLPLLAGAAAVPLAGRALRRRERRAAAERGSAAVSALCGTLAGDLRAGRPPHAALADAIETAGWPGTPELADAARLLLSAARFGGDVPQALRAAARLREGTRGLAAAAACWQVAVDGGAGLAAALDRVAAALRAEADQRDDLRAQLAGPRSTAVLLALLPLFGVVLGAGLGAHPATVLLHTPTGLLCLLAGAFLEWAGLAWTSRIIRAAEGGSPPAASGVSTTPPPDDPPPGHPGPVHVGPSADRVRVPLDLVGDADAVADGQVRRMAGVPRAVVPLRTVGGALPLAGAGDFGGGIHRLGMAVLALAAIGGAVALLVGAWRERGRVRRLRVALGETRPDGVTAGRIRRIRGPLREWGPVAAAGLGAAALVGGVLGFLAGLVAALGARRWLTGRQAAAEGSAVASGPDPAELPLCADLMAACLAAGATPGETAGAVGRCLGGRLGGALIRVHAELRLGADPVECWQRFGGLPAAREMGRCLARASTTGSAPVAEMSRLAADLRAAHGRTALARARKAAVLATAPLGLCFLPAFLLVGVAPVVMGLAGTVLGGRAG